MMNVMKIERVELFLKYGFVFICPDVIKVSPASLYIKCIQIVDRLPVQHFFYK